MSGFTSYQVARSGLFTSERALYVTGQNLANVNTTGYSRQQAIITSVAPDNSGKFSKGMGSSIEETRQIRNTFLDNVYRAENEVLGYQETRKKTLDDVESIIGEPMTDGMQSVLNKFWDSWQELSKTPESLTTRALVRQRADGFVTQVNHIGDQINKLQDDLNSEISVDIEQINTLASNISDLNVKILRAESNGDLANDYKDQRANYIDRLSKLININVNERQDSMVDIDISGQYLVNGADHRKMYGGQNTGGSTFIAPRWVDSDQLVTVRGGTLKGLLEARGEDVIGSISSVSNGSPNTKGDITFAIDLSADTFGAANLQNIKNNISKFIDKLENKGIDYKFNLITFGGTAGADAPLQFNDRASFEAAVNALAVRPGVNNDFFSVINKLQNNVTYRNEANRYLMAFTNESIQGDEVIVNAAALQTQVDNLNSLGMTTFVATNKAYLNDKNPEPGWQTIADKTGGKTYDLASVDMAAMGTDIDGSVNAKISTVPASNNIIANMKRKLNALINIIAREINSLHKTGVDKYGNPGKDFFIKTSAGFPLQMGNIQLNPDFEQLDKIAAAKTPSDGDNTLAQAINDLRKQTLYGDKTEQQNVDDFYRSIILALGNSGSEAARLVDGQKQLVESSSNQRNATSAVSMDEEMSNMIKYQYSYSAASRFLTLIDQCMQTVIEKLGTQGR
jgi:flagellar hook-associated protein 1 FlgK